MNKIQSLLLICTILFSGASYSQTKPEPEEAQQITQLITALAELTDMADACGEHMNYYGKKSLEGAVCKEFNEAFYSKWESREALQEIVNNYAVRLEQGELVCERCQLMLQRVEELRITITYYLDYMDFIKEM